MDADPLYNVKQLFYQFDPSACIQEATSRAPTPSDPLSLARAIYAARAHLALSPPAPSAARAVLAPFLEADTPATPAAPAARAVTALAAYVEGSDKAARVDEVRDAVIEYEAEGADAGVEGENDERLEGAARVAAATVFILEGENEEAVATLTEGKGKTDLECLALLVQLLLSLDRRDLAQATYNTAKRIGNDSLLVQAIEAWIGLKTGARPLHQSYYFYEELYQLPAGRTLPVLASHAAAHLLLGHVDEAKADIADAAGREGGATDADVLAVGTSAGLEGYAEKLQASAPAHPFAVDLREKSSAFDEAAAKFAIAA
ncbi:hypothetical protein Q5752_004731 [Cryptotrichosporon argae]